MSFLRNFSNFIVVWSRDSPSTRGCSGLELPDHRAIGLLLLTVKCQGQVLDKGCAPLKVHVLYCQMQLANKLGYVRSYYIHCPSECCVGTLEKLEMLNLMFLVPIAFDGLILS